MNASATPDSDSVPRLQRLFESLEAAPYRFELFAALRRVESLNRTRPRLGRALRPRDEAIRLGQDAEMDFAPAEVSSFRTRAGSPPRLGQRAFGLFGPAGALPTHLTEFARDRERHQGDAAFVRFADQFHHRALLLFYRAWAQSEPTVHLDRTNDDAFSRWVGAFAGFGEASFLGRDSLDDDAKRHRVALLARGAKGAEGLVRILTGWFGAPVRLEPYVGHWLAMRPEDRTRLSPATQPGLRNRLGHDAVAGSRVWDRQFRFRLHLGPLSYGQYRRFLPGERALVELRDWVRQYVGLSMSYDVVAWLRGSDVPKLQLGARGEQLGRLGWTTWLGTRRPHRDRGDLHVRPREGEVHHG